MEIEIYNVDKIQKANLTSIGKRMSKKWIATQEWAEDQLHAQHSTLEFAHIYLEALVTTTEASHIVRHTKGHPRFVVESHRPDWTGKPRPKDPSTYRRIILMFTPYAFIEMCRQRLCHLAQQETRIFFESICREMTKSGDVMLASLGRYAMPDCMYRGGTCHTHRKAWENCRMLPHWRDL